MTFPAWVLLYLLIGFAVALTITSDYWQTRVLDHPKGIPAEEKTLGNILVVVLAWPIALLISVLMVLTG